MAAAPRKLLVLTEPFTRRRLLEAGAAGLAAAFALPLASACGPGPVERDAGPDAGRPGDGGPADAGSGCALAPCTVDANTLVLPLAQHPELVPVLGWSVYHDSRYDDPVCHGDQILVIQVSQGQYVALSASCTHACCTVELEKNGETTDLFCPCHESTYGLDGVAASGPALATGNLPTLPVCFDGCSVYVQLA